MSNDYNYQKLRDACKLLKNYDLQPILRDVLGDFKDLNYKVKLEDDSVLFVYENGKKVYLDMSGQEVLFLRGDGSYLFESIKIDLSDIRKEVLVKCTTLEIRSTGVLVTEKLKNYLKSYHTGKLELMSLEENCRVYKTKTETGDLLSFRNTKEDLMRLMEMVDQLILQDTFVDFGSSLKILQENLDIYVEVNGEDVSYLYNGLDGNGLVNRVYELYYGVITEKNSRDIYLIHLDKLSMDAFGFRQLKGISSSESVLIGVSNLEKSNAYYQYIDKFFQEQFGVVCQDKNSRIGLLKCITKIDGTVFLERRQPEFAIEKDVYLKKESVKKLKRTFSNKILKKKRKS